MSENMERAYIQMKKEKRQNGLRFGLMAGLGFSLTLWGLDSLLLMRASADLPYLKLVFGVPFCLLFGALAGWLSVRMDNGLLTAITWLLAGLGFVWAASHAPFDGTSSFVGLLNPDLRGLDIYPFVEVARLRMSFLYIVVGVLMAIGGSLGLFIVEAATRASHAATRWLVLVVGGLFIFGIIGAITDDLINEPLRQPLVSISGLIEYGRQAQVQTVTKEEARQMGLRALRPFGDLIFQPYRLILGNYDPETITETSVYVDFNGTWGTCFLIGATPMYCQLSDDLYAGRLACLMQGHPEWSCRMKVAPGSEEAFQTLVELAGVSPEMHVYNQYGNAVMLEVTAPGAGHQLCFLRFTGDIFFDRCEPFGNRTPASTVAQAEVAAPSGIPSPFPTLVNPTSAASKSYRAVLPELQGNLPSLSSAPRYTIDVDVDFAGHTFQGRALVDYTNNESISLGEVYFRLLPNGHASYGNGSLKVIQVLLNGQPAETTLSQDDTVLMVKMPRQLMPGTLVQFDLEFYGVVPENFGGDAAPAGYGIYNLSQEVLAMASWYPILAVYDQTGWNLDPVSPIGDSVYSDVALYDVRLTAPHDLVVVTTGVQTEWSGAAGRKTLRYESGPARDFFIIASPDFEVVNNTIGGTTINSYYLPGDSDGGQHALAVASDSLRIYNDKFGRYPFIEMDVVEAPMRNASGVEYPGIMLIGAHLYAAPEKPEFATTVAHEVAHQWWYAIVGNDVFAEPWLDEALTTYSSSLYFEFEEGPQYVQGLVDYWQERYDTLSKDGFDDLITQDLAHFESLNNPRVYGGVVYTKGALFFKELRQRIGDEAFFEALANYYQSYRFKIAAGEDLLNLFEKAYGQQLDVFYQVWLYSKQ